MACQSCDALTINGIYCHEFGCPEKAKEKIDHETQDDSQDIEEKIFRVD